MNIRIARTDAEIKACFPVLRELRPQLVEAGFLSRIRAQEAVGYRLVYLQVASGVVAVSGFRVRDNLASGRHLYVDDLVTAAAHRSRGHGRALLAWLRVHATQQSCAEIHLDSGFQRVDAHRFYEREGLAKVGYYFVGSVIDS